MRMRNGKVVVLGAVIFLIQFVIVGGESAAPAEMTAEDQIGAVLLSLGLAAGAAMACKLPSHEDQEAVQSYLATVPDGARRQKLVDVYVTGAGSAMGMTTRDKNFPAICQTAVPDTIKKADPMREFLMRQTR
jgi:hypothetical protein